MLIEAIEGLISPDPSTWHKLVVSEDLVRLKTFGLRSSLSLGASWTHSPRLLIMTTDGLQNLRDLVVKTLHHLMIGLLLLLVSTADLSDGLHDFVELLLLGLGLVVKLGHLRPQFAELLLDRGQSVGLLVLHQVLQLTNLALPH